MGSPWFVMLKDEHRKAKRSTVLAAVAIALFGWLFALAHRRNSRPSHVPRRIARLAVSWIGVAL